jgi:hypothetical protein
VGETNKTPSATAAVTHGELVAVVAVGVACDLGEQRHQLAQVLEGQPRGAQLHAAHDRHEHVHLLGAQHHRRGAGRPAVGADEVSAPHP